MHDPLHLELGTVLEIMRKQLVNTEQRKNNLLMKVDYVEEEIAKKTKELKALK